MECTNAFPFQIKLNSTVIVRMGEEALELQRKVQQVQTIAQQLLSFLIVFLPYFDIFL